MGKAETGARGEGSRTKAFYVREGFWPARLRAGLGSSVWQSRHRLVQAACWAQHPGWGGGLSAGSRLLSGVLRPSGLGRSERDRESLTSIFLGCGQSQKSLPLRGSPRSRPAVPRLRAGAWRLPQVGQKVKTLLISGPAGAPSKPRESPQPQGLSAGPGARPGEQDSFSRAADWPEPCRTRRAGRNSTPTPAPAQPTWGPCLCVS